MSASLLLLPLQSPFIMTSLTFSVVTRKYLSKATPAEEFAKFLNYDQNRASAVKPAVEYQGFDTESIMSQLVRKRDSYMARTDVRMTYEPLRKSNFEDLESDIRYLVFGALIYNRDIAKARRGNVGKEFFIMLNKKYDIKDGCTSMESSVITLGKIVKLCPVVCSRLFHIKRVEEIVPYDTFPGSTKPETHAICCPLLQSSCPFILKAENNFHPVMLWVQIKLDDIIHSRDGNTTSLSQILSYYMAAYHCKAMPEAARIRHFITLGIIIQEETTSGQTWKLTDSSAQLAANCLSELYNMRRDDENHATLLKLARTGQF